MISETMGYVIEQTKTIYETAKNKKAFNYNFDKLFNNRFRAINDQLNLYKERTELTIKKEIFNELINFLNFEEIEVSINNDLSQKKVLPNLQYKTIKIPKFTPTVPQFNNEELIKLHDNLNDETINSFYNYCQLKTSELEKFESKACKYREKIKKILLKNTDYFVEVYKKNKFLKNMKIDFKNFYSINIKKILRI